MLYRDESEWVSEWVSRLDSSEWMNLFWINQSINRQTHSTPTAIFFRDCLFTIYKTCTRVHVLNQVRHNIPLYSVMHANWRWMDGWMDGWAYRIDRVPIAISLITFLGCSCTGECERDQPQTDRSCNSRKQSNSQTAYFTVLQVTVDFLFYMYYNRTYCTYCCNKTNTNTNDIPFAHVWC